MRARAPWALTGALIACSITGPGCGSRLAHREFVSSETAAHTRTGARVDVGSSPPQDLAGTDEAAPAVAAGTTPPDTGAAGPAPTAGRGTTGDAQRPGAPGAIPADPGGRRAPTPPSTAPPGRPAASAGAASAARTPLRLGQVSSLSGPVGSNLSLPALKAVQAWVAAANAHGGLAGHPVELTVADDGNDPSRNRALVQQLVERNKVVAFVHNSSPLSGGGSVQYIQEHQVPVVGIEGGSHWANENAMYFPQMPNYQYLGFTYAGATAEVAVPLGKAKVALVSCVESSACQAAVSPDAFRKAGMTVVYEARVSLAQPDFTAQCLGARNANADVAFIGLDSGSVMRMADSCASVGFDPLYGWPSNVVNDDQLHNPRLDGGVVGLPTAPWFVESLPAVAEMRAAMAAYAPGAPVTAAAVLGWTSAKLMELAASDLPEPPTSAAILDGLWKIRDNDLGGLTYPLTFMKGAPNNAESMKGCWWAVRVQDRRWTAPNGAERRCRP